MKKYIVIPSIVKECKVTEVVNAELQRRTALIFEGEDIEVSDGHHTMDDLYEHRHRLFIALCKIYDNYITPLASRVRCWKSKLHDDGSEFEGWFIMGMTVKNMQPFNPNEGMIPDYYITYHLPMKYWELAKVIELANAPKWDGHTSNDVLERLLRL